MGMELPKDVLGASLGDLPPEETKDVSGEVFKRAMESVKDVDENELLLSTREPSTTASSATPKPDCLEKESQTVVEYPTVTEVIKEV